MVQELSGARVLTGASSQSSLLRTGKAKKDSPYAPCQCLVVEELTADTIHCILATSLVWSLNYSNHFLAFCSSALHVLMVEHWAACAQSCTCWHSTAAKEKSWNECSLAATGEKTKLFGLYFILVIRCQNVILHNLFSLNWSLKESFIHSSWSVLWTFIGRASWEEAGVQNRESRGKERGL